MIKVGVVGGAGYTAGELLRILINHPEAELTFINSTSNAGNPVYKVHTDLLGDTDLVFTSEMPVDSVDVIFLCMGHGLSIGFMEQYNVPEHVKVIDLSRDYRLIGEHNFVYGLPEINRDEIIKSNRIANPGCFATAIQLALLPLASNLLLINDIHVNATTGSTGAGQKPTATSHFSWRNNNISVYKAFTHQHLDEINQSLKQLQSSYSTELNFLPMRGNFARGIMATAYMNIDVEEEELIRIYKEFYETHPFVTVSDVNPHLKQVVNTNKGIVYVTKHENKVFVVSIIDNLVKGASGQAVQNMNLMFNLEETTGLRLKSNAF